ncbi:hypothetical protein [Guptibacillus hwajinpoensis]|uniref:hypothetical protein n=1 Tax=Guptibacillus hwajinpoensis TaxID=208199 RepID=UPI003D094D9F
MNGIVKRRKTADYAQIHNGALQTLEDVRSIGLIAHLMSLPESWEIKKMQLYNKFGRGPIANGIKELESKKYWVDIKYRNGKKNYHYYNASDVAFNNSEVTDMINEVKSNGYKVMEISEPFQHLLSIGENQHLKETGITCDSSNDDSQHFIINNSNSTVENRQLINKEVQINSNKRNKVKENIVNNHSQEVFKNALTDACNDLYNQFAVNRWSKRQWLTLVRAFVDETMNEHRYKHIPLDNVAVYAHASLSNIAHKSDMKHGKIESDYEPIYNWNN